MEHAIPARAVPRGSAPVMFVKRVIKNRYVLYLISIVGLLIIWHISAVSSKYSRYMPTPYMVLNELWRIAHENLAGNNLWGHLWSSLHRVLIGFAIGSLVGVPLGLFMALNRYVNALVKPVFDLIKPMPPISWISLAILWFGIGEESKVFIITIGAFVPALINAYNGIRLVDPALYDAIRMLGANRWQTLVEVTFPAGFPALFAGLQIALSVAWSCVLAAELVSARSGMGFLIILGMTMSNPAMILSGMVVIAITAYLITVVLSKVEKWVCPWRVELPQ
jgi:ABC-type nitrate/sulfonate/bicarbonate transport system permease component